MKQIFNYITEAVVPIKLKTSKNIPSNIKYAEKVNIRKNDYVIIVIEEKDGFACALCNPKDVSSRPIYTYLSATTNIVKHFDYALNPGKTKKTADIGPDGEMHYGVTTTKAAMPKLLAKEVIENKKAQDSFRKIDLWPDQVYYLIKNGNKNKGLWKVPYSLYISKTQTDSDSFKICIDGVYYDNKINYIRDLMPNPNIGIKKTDKLVILNNSVLNDNPSETSVINRIFYSDIDGVLFIISDRHFQTDGGKFIPCEFVKMEGNILHLTKRDAIKASVDDVRAQIIE